MKKNFISKHISLIIFIIPISLIGIFLLSPKTIYAATEFTSIIDPDNGTGTDYTSLNAWEAANQVDLTATSTLVFSHSGITGTIPDGSTVTGATSGIKGEVTHATSTQVLIQNIRTSLTGTLTFTNGSTAVSGTGTLFTTELAVGDYIWLDADSTWAEVSSITDDSNLVLSVAYTGTGGTGAGAVRKGNFTSGEQVYETLDTNYVTISDAGDSAIAVASCRSSNGTADTTAVTIDGWTTGSTNYIKIWTDPSLGNRHNGKWDERKYRLEVNLITGDYGIVVYDNYVTIDGLQIKVSRNTYAANGIYVNSSVGDSTISNNIIRANFIDSARSGIYAGIYIGNGTGQSNHVYNNIIYDFGDNYADNTIAGIFGNYSAQYIYNNTIYNCDYGFFAGNSMTGSRLINNIVQNSNVADYYFANGSANFDLIDYNISSDDTAPGANSKINQTVSFVSTTSGSEDFHLAQSDTSARDAGTDLSSDPDLSFTTDIDNQTRGTNNNWDIGADEYTVPIYRSVGPSATTAIDDDNSHTNTITISNGTATFTSAITNNVGVGDVIVWDSNDDNVIDTSDTNNFAFIESRTDSTHYILQTQTGGIPSDLASNDTFQIYRAYTSLVNAESGIENSSLTNLGISFTGGDRDLVTNNEQWNIACYANGTTADIMGGSWYIGYGWTSGKRNYLKIYTPTESDEVGISQRHNGKWDNTRYYINHTSATTYSGLVVSQIDDIKIEGLQIVKTGISTNSPGISVRNSVDGDTYLENNLIFSLDGSEYFSLGIIYQGNGNAFIYNNIVYNNTSGGIRAADGNGAAYIYNNTVYNTTVYWPITNYGFVGDVVVKNNIAENCAGDCYHGTFDASSDYNISSDDTAPGANSKINQTVNFISTTSGIEDFHLAQSDTSARDAGTDLASEGLFTDDIDGTTRTGFWDIGADEGSVEFTPTVMESGGDYSSLSAWEAGVQTDLTASTTRVFSHGGITGTISDNSTVTGATSGATATVVHATNTQILLENISGTFQSGEQVYETLDTNYIILSDNGNPAIAVAKIDGTWTNPDTTAVTIDGWTTDHDNYIKIYTTSTARHKGITGSGYVLNVASSNNCITVRDNYVTIDGLEIRRSTESLDEIYGIYLSLWNVLSDVTISNNLIHDISGNSYSMGIGIRAHTSSQPKTNIKIYNNIIYNIVGDGIYIDNVADHTGWIYNNTIYNCNLVQNAWRGGIADSSNNFILKNNISVNNYNVDYYDSSNASSDYNISSDDTAPGANSKINQTVNFISTTSGSEDFHLASYDTSAKDAGTNLSTDSYLPFSTDIDGNSRPIGSGWDIGADESGLVRKVRMEGDIKFEGSFKFD